MGSFFLNAQNDNYSLWNYSKNIVINTSPTGVNISSGISNYPLLIRLTSDNFNFLEAQTGGQDIRFAASDGTHLQYEIERWDNSGQEAELWVNTGLLGDNSTQFVTMYWGYALAGDSSNATGVFNINYNFVAVYHLQEDGNTNPDGYKDATSNNNDATGYNFNTSSDVSANIGLGQEFDGASSYMVINNDLFKDILTSTQSMTVSFWVKTDATNYARAILWEGRNGSDGFGSEEEIHIGYGEPNGSLNDDYFHFYSGDENDNNNTGDHCNVEYATSDATNWHHVAITYDATAPTERAELFWDGISVDVETGSVGGDYGPSWNSNTLIGTMGSLSRKFDGILDELRFSRNIFNSDFFVLDANIQNGGGGVEIENIPPTLLNIESSTINYTENDGWVNVSSTIDIDDGDDNLFYSAQISIGSFQTVEDELSFTSIGNISGSWNSATGVLTLSGTDTKANFLLALRSLVYRNTSEDPNTTTRTISFTIFDADDNSNFANRNIFVAKANDAPADISLSNNTIDENQSLGYVIGNLSSTDIDAGDSHTYSLVAGSGDTGNGSFQILGNQLQSNVIFDEEAQNSYSIRLRTTDNGTGDLYFEDVFVITINDINDPAEFTSTAITTATEDLAYSYNITTTDDDGDVPTITAPTLPAWLSFTDNGDGTATLSGTPTYYEIGDHIVVLNSFDGFEDSQQIFSIAVIAGYSAPVTVNSTSNIDEDELLIVNVLGNVEYSGSETLVTNIIGTVSNGSAVITIDGELTYIPNLNYNGIELISYQVCVEGLSYYCDTAKVLVEINPINDAPQVTSQIIDVYEVGSIEICINVLDVDNDYVSVSELIENTSTYSQLSYDNNNLCFYYIPEIQQYTGEEVVVSVVCDNGSPSLCDTVNTTLVYHLEEPFSVMEGISPNGDGQNDVWLIKGIDRYPANTVKIFNRWGNLVFETKNYDNAINFWDGTMNKGMNLGEKAAKGTYFYIIEFDNGEMKPQKGYIIVN